MSISTSTRKAGPYAGNDVQTVFAYAFKIFATSDLVVTSAVTATGVETVLVLGVGYTATMNADQDAAPGGDVTLTTALPTGSVLVVTSAVPELQGVTVTNAGGFFPSVFNTVFDRLTILVQQLSEKMNRAFKVAVTSTVTDFSVPVLAGGVLQWNPGGTALIAQSLPDLSLSLALPAQGGNAGKFLSTDGVSASWSAAVPDTRTLTAAGLVTGGGTLAANRTFTVTAATVADVRAGTSSTTAIPPAALTGSAAFQTLAPAATVAWNMASGYNAKCTLDQNVIIGVPTNMQDGITYTLDLIQDGTGGRTASFDGAAWDFAATGAPTISTGAGKVTSVTAQYKAHTGKLRATALLSA